jgi:predicted alpha/beta-hydrolase family hydrolase
VAHAIIHDTPVSETRIPAGRTELVGDLSLPEHPHGIVLFAHGSGSSRHSSRNQFVASELNSAGIATLLFDLLTEREEWEERYTRHLRFDISMLAERLAAAANWTKGETHLSRLPLGFFGASTGGGAALVAAAAQPTIVKAVVSRGGRPDLAEVALADVQAPTLLIVGSRDEEVIRLNEYALEQLQCVKRLQLVPGATHLFEEPGTLEQVAILAKQWFDRYLR